MIGWVLCFSIENNVYVEKIYKQSSLHSKNGMAVDSKGYIFIGERESSSIQVYNSSGDFRFAITFPTLRAADLFYFNIIDDKVHIVTLKTGRYFVFNNTGEMMHSESINISYYQELIEKYHLSSSSTYVKENIDYKISFFNTMSIHNKENGQTVKIHLNAPLWPPSTFLYWLMGFVGLITVFLLNLDFFKDLHKK